MRFITKAAQPTALFIGECTPHLIKLHSKSFSFQFHSGGIGGNLAGELTEEILQKKFQPFGTIQEIRVFKDKGYAFVRFSTKEAATHAIVAIHNSEINQQTVKCSWGKESGDPNNVPAAIAAGQALSPTGFPFGYGQQQMGYW